MKSKHPDIRIVGKASVTVVVQVEIVSEMMRMVDPDEVDDSSVVPGLPARIIYFSPISTTGIFLLFSTLTTRNPMSLSLISSHRTGSPPSLSTPIGYRKHR